jgi:molybdopterin molybdotransferase
MISVDEALARIEEAARAAGPLSAEAVPLREAAGRVLRETIHADRDLPPFTRSAMDGYALRSADVARAPVELEVVEEVPAGSTPRARIGPGQCSRIMTGAMIPAGADAVQMVEKTEPAGARSVRILESVPAGQHVRRAGEDLRAGSVVLAEGALLEAAGIGLLASCGCATVRVSRRPRVTILPTGDELVPAGQEPGPGRIRESNGVTLEALSAACGAVPHVRPIVPDRLGDLREAVGAALREADVVLLSGGVSMGDYDLVGAALREEGCQALFTRVAIQPGKPLWFGTAGPERRVLVFGLPGNPVSTVVDFLVFARPALRLVSGATAWRNRLASARLAAPLRRPAGRRAYLPAALRETGGGLEVDLLPSMGSADMVSLARADALAIVPEAGGEFPAGFTLPVMLLRGEGASGA